MAEKLNTILHLEKLEENKDTDKRDGQVGHQFIRSDKMEHDKAGSLEDMSQPDFIRLGVWRICHSQILCVTLTKKYLQERGYVGFMNAYSNCGKD